MTITESTIKQLMTEIWSWLDDIFGDATTDFDERDFSHNNLKNKTELIANGYSYNLSQIKSPILKSTNISEDIQFSGNITVYIYFTSEQISQIFFQFKYGNNNIIEFVCEYSSFYDKYITFIAQSYVFKNVQIFYMFVKLYNYIKNITQMNIYVPSILKLISVNKLKEQLIQVNNDKYVYDETPDNYFIDIYESGNENIYLNYIDNTIDIEIITDSDENTTTEVFNYTYENNVITIYNPKHKHIHPEILNMFEYFGIQIKE